MICIQYISRILHKNTVVVCTHTCILGSSSQKRDYENGKKSLNSASKDCMDNHWRIGDLIITFLIGVYKEEIKTIIYINRIEIYKLIGNKSILAEGEIELSVLRILNSLL